jgi:hypothetical protein
MGLSNQIPSSRLIQPGVVSSASTRPASPFTGQCIFQTDTNQLLVWNGTAWVVIGNATGGGSNVRLAYQTSTVTYAVNQTVLASASDIFSSDLTWVADGTSTYWIEFYSPLSGSGYTGTSAYTRIYLVNGSGADLGTIALTEVNGVSGQRAYGSVNVKFPYTPSAGSTSINVRAIYVNGDNTGILYGGAGGAGNYVPMWCAVYGPALA